MKKTKNQSRFNFFESLQKEYIVAFVRSKIYPSVRDRKFYKERVMPGKKEKILEISSRNNLVSIFDKQEIFNEYYSSVIPNWGYPHFNYSSEENRKWQYNEDMMNYFAVDSEVAINEEDGVKVGIITSNDFLLSNHTVSVKKRGEKESKPISVTHLKRIL
jgi:hypothetical protein